MNLQSFKIKERNDLKSFFDYILKFDNKKEVVALDLCHNLLLFGALLSKKPKDILEIGIGSGYTTRTILYAIKYNRKGNLTCVDNWHDWKGKEPGFIKELRRKGAKVIAPVSEEEFTKQCDSNRFDFLISDGDHFHAGNWIDETLRIIKHDGFMFFHDTNQKKMFPNLQKIKNKIKKSKIPHYHFIEESRTDERSSRGWLFAINKKYKFLH